MGIKDEAEIERKFEFTVWSDARTRQERPHTLSIGAPELTAQRTIAIALAANKKISFDLAACASNPVGAGK